MHFESPSDPSQTAAAEAKPRYIYSILKPHGQSSGKPGQTAATRGEAELHILDFKITWSEFQKPCQTAATQGKAMLGTYNLKKTSPPQSWSQTVVCVSTPRMYPRSRYFLV